jgi:hypothetical protein
MLAFGIAAGAHAQQGQQHGMMMGRDPCDGSMMPMMMHMREMTIGRGSMPMMGMGQHVEGRLAFLKAELKISPAQEQLWNEFA